VYIGLTRLDSTKSPVSNGISFFEIINISHSMRSCFYVQKSCFMKQDFPEVLFENTSFSEGPVSTIRSPVFGLYIKNRVLFIILLMFDSPVLGGSISP
jgi:hypothetical protein